MTVNFGDVFDAVARHVPAEAPAILCDGETTTWAQFDHRSNALARALLAAGLGRQAKVALFMRNGPDYLIAFVAALKAGLAPVNINYRYSLAELAYLLDNSDSEAVVFDVEFAEAVTALTLRHPLRALFSARGAAPGAEALAGVYAGDGAPLPSGRDPQDIFLLYTGGTTGMPKGVMWTSQALWETLAAAPSRAGAPMAALDDLTAGVRDAATRLRFNIPPPLMHGTGLFAALSILARGGSVVCSARRSFDPLATVEELETLRCDGLVIVGDAFARPILDVLRGAPRPYDLAHISLVVSSGMMWSPEVKTGLLEHMPNAVLSDGLGASESAGVGYATTSRGQPPAEARFELSPSVKVVRPDDLTPVEPGSGEVGVIAKAGGLPLGYYKDAERTARTYVLIDGVRHILGGDHATVEADGAIRLLGRGSHCINTAGEKVYPEEVEEALKTHPAVTDALVFGLDDARYGQSIAAVVAASAEARPDELIAHVRARLAAYKAPKVLTIHPAVPRAVNGKADYAAARILFAGARNATSET